MGQIESVRAYVRVCFGLVRGVDAVDDYSKCLDVVVGLTIRPYWYWHQEQCHCHH